MPINCAAHLRRLVSVVLGAAALATGCGSDDAPATTIAPMVTTDAAATSVANEPGASDHARAGIVEFTVSAGAAAGFTFDRACIAALIDTLGDDDVALLASSIAAGDADPQLSAEGEALGDRIYADCLVGSSDQALVDAVVIKVLAESPGIDESCVRTTVGKLNDAQLNLLLDDDVTQGPVSTDPQLQVATLFLLDCVGLD